MSKINGLNKNVRLILASLIAFTLQTQDAPADGPDDVMRPSSQQEGSLYPEYNLLFYLGTEKPLVNYTEEDRTLLILNGYYEVFGDPEFFGPSNGQWEIKEGKGYFFRKAVAGVSWVVINRLNDPENRWSKTIEEIISQPSQFSWYNSYDPYRIKSPKREPEYMTIIEEVVQGVLYGEIPDPTNGATYYQNKKLSRVDFKKAYNLKETVKIGSHTFYK